MDDHNYSTYVEESPFDREIRYKQNLKHEKGFERLWRKMKPQLPEGTNTYEAIEHLYHCLNIAETWVGGFEDDVVLKQALSLFVKKIEVLSTPSGFASITVGGCK